MAEEIVDRRTLQEFVITVLAILFGLIVGKFAAKGIAMAGVPIDAGNPRPVSLPGAPKTAWRT